MRRWTAGDSSPHVDLVPYGAAELSLWRYLCWATASEYADELIRSSVTGQSLDPPAPGPRVDPACRTPVSEGQGGQLLWYSYYTMNVVVGVSRKLHGDNDYLRMRNHSI